MKTTGKLGKYSWVIEAGWTTLYIGDPSEGKTIIDGFVTCDPEEAILKSITNDTAKPSNRCSNPNNQQERKNNLCQTIR